MKSKGAGKGKASTNWKCKDRGANSKSKALAAKANGKKGNTKVVLNDGEAMHKEYNKVYHPACGNVMQYWGQP